jgi:hypothetical protein
VITTNVFNRTFNVRYKNSSGTAFTVDIDGRQYLISARHVFPDITGPAVIEIFHKDGWHDLPVALTGFPSTKADVIVLAPAQRLSPAYPLPISPAGAIIGQEVHFLGFPYGLRMEIGEMNNHFPLPLVKRACLSAQIGASNEKMWLLDGFNNPGFSGGPVVFRPPGLPASDLKVLGIISAYRYEEQPAYLENKATEYRIRSNTGIVYAYHADIALQIIATNPNGLAVE